MRAGRRGIFRLMGRRRELEALSRLLVAIMLEHDPSWSEHDPSWSEHDPS